MVQVAPADLGESHDEWGEEPVKKPSRFKGKFKSAVKKVLLSQGRTKKEKKTFWGHVRIALRRVSKHLQFNIWNYTIKVIGGKYFFAHEHLMSTSLPPHPLQPLIPSHSISSSPSPSSRTFFRWQNGLVLPFAVLCSSSGLCFG